MSQEEEWRTCGITPNYEISDAGRVRNRLTGHILASFIGNSGYRVVGVRSATGKWRQIRISLLVTTAFHGPRPKGMQVEHKDQNKLHDQADNLMWATQSTNIRRSYQLTNRRRASGYHRLSPAAYDQICQLWATGKYSQVRIAAATGLVASTISRIVSGRRDANGSTDIVIDYAVLDAPPAIVRARRHYPDSLIRKVIRSKRPVKWIVARYGLGRSYVYHLRSGRFRRDITRGESESK